MPHLLAAEQLFAGPGALRAHCRALDWGATPLGPVEGWPQSLRTAVDMCLASRFPTALLWGPELALIHNEAHVPVLGTRHPGAMGRPAGEALSDTWPVLGPLVARTLADAEAGVAGAPGPIDIAVTFDRGAGRQPGHLTVSCSAVRDEAGRPAGVVIAAVDRTARALAEEATRARERFLLALSDAIAPLGDAEAIRLTAATVLGRHLRASRVAYAEDCGDGMHFDVMRSYVDGVADASGRFRYADFGADLLAELRAGRTRVQPDIRHDARLTEAERRTLLDHDVAASLNVPLVKEGRLVALLGINFATAHAFTPQEVELVREVAERTWAAVERARAEAALRASEEQFRRSLEEAPIPVIMHAEDGEVLQVSRTWTELTGWTIDEVPTFDAWLTRAYGPGADAVREHVHALFAGARRTMSVEFPVRTRRGEVRHWSFSASAPGTLRDGRRFVVGMALDVTDRRHAEEALRASEERYRTLVDNVHDYAIFLLDPQGRVTEWTAGAERVTGYSAAEALGRPFTDFYPPEDVAAGDPARHLALAAAAGRGEWEGWRVRRDGTRFWANEIATAAFDAEGRLVGFTKISRDLTERRLAEQAAEEAKRASARDELRRALVAAEEAERERLARELHDVLGQELTALRLGLDEAQRVLTARGGDGDAETALRLRLSQLQELASRMAAGARAIALELRPPELDDVGLASALDSYAREWSARYGVPVEVAVAEDGEGARGGAGPPVTAEVATALYRIAQEALTNVAKHAHASQVSLVVDQPDHEVRMIVEDDGRGFDVEATAARARRERRLGLSGMRERATLLGGTIEVESTPGGGTTIYVRLPLGGE